MTIKVGDKVSIPVPEPPGRRNDPAMWQFGGHATILEIEGGIARVYFPHSGITTWMDLPEEGQGEGYPLPPDHSL